MLTTSIRCAHLEDITKVREMRAQSEELPPANSECGLQAELHRIMGIPFAHPPQDAVDVNTDSAPAKLAGCLAGGQDQAGAFDVIRERYPWPTPPALPYQFLEHRQPCLAQFLRHRQVYRVSGDSRQPWHGLLRRTQT